MQRRVLVVGAQPWSIGAAVYGACEDLGWLVQSAGISGEEHELDVTDKQSIKRILELQEWDTVVCTAGLNLESRLQDPALTTHLNLINEVNFVGVVNLLEDWVCRTLYWMDETKVVRPTLVALSSNSAHIPRSRSLAYCASKAALSMAVRCAARQMADTELIIWGVEPGWVMDTPMSQAVEKRINHGVAPVQLEESKLHRIPGGRMLHRVELARVVVDNIFREYDWLNGWMLRLDGGEQ